MLSRVGGGDPLCWQLAALLFSCPWALGAPLTPPQPQLHSHIDCSPVIADPCTRTDECHTGRPRPGQDSPHPPPSKMSAGNRDGTGRGALCSTASFTVTSGKACNLPKALWTQL